MCRNLAAAALLLLLLALASRSSTAAAADLEATTSTAAAVHAAVATAADVLLDDKPLDMDQLSDEHLALLLELEERLQGKTREEVRGYVDDVVNKVKDVANGWIADAKNALTKSVADIKSKAEGSVNGLVNTMMADVTSYARTYLVTPFQNFFNKLDAVKTEVEAVVQTVVTDAAAVLSSIETAAVALAQRAMNPFNIPDDVQCTSPSFLPAADAKSWCKLTWAADKFGLNGFLDKMVALGGRHAGTSMPSLLEVEAGSAAATSANEKTATCNGPRAAAAVFMGINTCINLVLSAIDVESALQFELLGLAAKVNGVGTILMSACAGVGQW